MIGVCILCFVLGVITTILFGLTFICTDLLDYDQFVEDLKNQQKEEESNNE